MKSIVRISLLVYLVFGLYLYIQQRSFIYFPTGQISSELTQKIFENDGHRISVSVLNEGKDKAIIYFGGNAENVDNNAANFEQLFPDYALFLLKYRGYGGSTGYPTEQGLYSDALHVYDEIKGHYQNISAMGRSLGSGVATYLAVNREIEKLVLITPFDSVQSLAQSRYPIYPMAFLLKDKHDSHGRADKITAQTLVIAAENDGLIGMSHTQRLIDGFSMDVLFEVIEGANHNNISGFPPYNQILGDFL